MDQQLAVEYGNMALNVVGRILEVWLLVKAGQILVQCAALNRLDRRLQDHEEKSQVRTARLLSKVRVEESAAAPTEPAPIPENERHA